MQDGKLEISTDSYSVILKSEFHFPNLVSYRSFWRKVRVFTPLGFEIQNNFDQETSKSSSTRSQLQNDSERKKIGYMIEKQHNMKI